MYFVSSISLQFSLTFLADPILDLDLEVIQSEILSSLRLAFVS